MATFKIVKTTNWETADKRKGTTLVLAHKGRIYVCNPANFDNGVVTKDTFEPGEPVEALKSVYTDIEGTQKVGKELLPVNDINLVDA